MLRKILESDLSGRGVIPLPNRPTIGAQPLKAKFDQLVTDVIVPITNQNVDTQEPLNAQVPIALENSQKAKTDSAEALNLSTKAIQAVSGGSLLVTDPTTGEKVSVQDAILNVFLYLSPGAIKCEELDAKQITYDSLDALQLDYVLFDTNAKNLT